LSGWLVEELKAHRERTSSADDALMFATVGGQPKPEQHGKRC
jgi:hypothetical protein